MEDFRYVLIVIGVLAIIGLLLHGMWSIRRQQPRKMKAKPLADVAVSDSGSSVDKDGFDADGIGSVRTIKVDKDEQEPMIGSVNTEVAPVEPVLKQEPSIQEPVSQQLPKEVETSEPAAATIEPTTVEPIMNSQPEQTVALEPVVEESRQVEPQPSVQAEPEAQPASVESDPLFASREQLNAEVEPAPENKVITEPVDVLVLHVVAKEGEALQGAELLHNFLTLGMKFGEMNIFHRHQDSAGRGPVMYSVANMVQPGVFEPNTMEQFETEGVSLFMTLPNQCDETVGFSMMLGAAQALADMHDANLLDDGHNPWSDLSKERYMSRIQAFETSPSV